MSLKDSKFKNLIWRMLFPGFIPENNVVERVEKLKENFISEYSQIKQSQKKDILVAAQKVNSDDTSSKLNSLAKKTENQIRETKDELKSREEYLQSIADVIGRR